MWWGAVTSACFLDEEHWSVIDEPVHVAFGTDVPPPNISALEAFQGLRGIVYWYVRKPGRYRLRVTIPPRPCYDEKGYTYAENVLYALRMESGALLFTFPHVTAMKTHGVLLPASHSTLIDVGPVEIQVFNYAPEGGAVVVSAGYAELLWEGIE
jgi:hypothetical protein